MAATIVGVVTAAALLGFWWSHRERTYPNTFSNTLFKTNVSLNDALSAHHVVLPADAVGTRYAAVAESPDMDAGAGETPARLPAPGSRPLEWCKRSSAAGVGLLVSLPDGGLGVSSACRVRQGYHGGKSARPSIVKVEDPHDFLHHSSGRDPHLPSPIRWKRDARPSASGLNRRYDDDRNGQITRKRRTLRHYSTRADR